MHLVAGHHTLWVPFTTAGSIAQFTCTLAEYCNAQDWPLALVTRATDVEAAGRPMLFGDIVDGVLASEIGSVVVENRGQNPMSDFQVVRGAQHAQPFTVAVATEETGALLDEITLGISLKYDLRCACRTASCSRTTAAATTSGSTGPA